MNSRERVLRAIRFQRPDRVPLGYHISPLALFQHGQALIDLCRQYPNDFYDLALIKLPERDTANYQPDGTYYKVVTDAWGCEWVYYQEGIMGEVKRSPLADWARLETHPFPPIAHSAPAELAKLRDELTTIKERFIGWGSGGSLFEQMQWLRGVEDLLVDIALDCDEVYRLADRLVEEHLLPNIEVALATGAEVIGFTDDWGTQERLLIHPEAWRRIFKPRYQRLFERIHAGGALAWLHTDGMMLEVLPDLIDIGLDVVNPQLSCMDLAALQRLVAGRIAIYGTLDYQRVLPFGTPDDVRAHVRLVTDTLATPDGGFIYGAGVFGQIPFENIVALFEAMAECRQVGCGV